MTQEQTPNVQAPPTVPAEQPAEQPSASEQAAAPVAGGRPWQHGDDVPEGFVEAEAVLDDDGNVIVPARLAVAEAHPSTVAVHATAAAPLECVISGETIAVGEEYIDGGPGYGPVKVGHAHEAKRTA